MTNKIRVALPGLGEFDQTFAEHLLEKIQEHGTPVQRGRGRSRYRLARSPIGFSQDDVPVYKVHWMCLNSANR
jgi:hypothetical protein